MAGKVKAAVALLIVAGSPVFAAMRRRPVVAPQPFPPCAIVNGTPAVTFTRDDGQTLAPIADRLEGIGYTFGLAALDAPGALLSWHKLTLSLSTDDGCSWHPVATASSIEYPPAVTAAPGGSAYVWSDNRRFIARWDSRGLQPLKAPGEIIGIGVDATTAEHLRVGTSDGRIWETTDGGQEWNQLGQLVLSLPLIYRVAFDPYDLDHLVLGAATVGASVSRDGGRTWTRSNISDGFNAFNLAFSPVDGNVVWMMALEEKQSQQGPAYGRHIFLSNDGGSTFHAVVNQTDSVTLTNGPLLAPDPRNAAVLYFVFGTYFQGYGTDLFRYDAASRNLSVTHNNYAGVNAIAFSRSDPRVMYIGLETAIGR